MENSYNGAITREAFLFYEMRITAQLLCQGLDEKDIISRIEEENLFQFPTEKMIKNMAMACLKRLYCLEDANLLCNF